MAKRFLASKRRKAADLEIELRQTDRQLGQLNRELASELTTLAEATGDTSALIQAVEALRSAKRYYSFEDAPLEHALVQQSIADTLLTLGQKTDDHDALMTARDAYRGAITLASLLSDEKLREDLRTNYKITQSLLGETKAREGLFKVA
jgi:hypothetical protein